MTNPIPVPDIPGPRRPLCWRQDPARLIRCDRARGHQGLHTWEWAAITTALAEAEAELAALKARWAQLREWLTDHSLGTTDSADTVRIVLAYMAAKEQA